MKDRDLKLDGYNISGNRYRELKYFCRQYREKQSLLRSITEVGSPPLSGGGSGKLSDKTASTAIRRTELQRDLEMIEQTAIEADAEIYTYILSNVADGVPLVYLSDAENFTRQEENSFIFSRRKKGNKRDVLLCYSSIMEKKRKRPHQRSFSEESFFFLQLRYSPDFTRLSAGGSASAGIAH